MNDPEFIEMRNKFLISLLIVSIFAALFIVFLFKLIGTNSNVDNKVLQNKDVLILVVDKNCARCNAVKEVLKDNDIKYSILDRYKDNKTKYIYQKIGLDDEITTPCILSIKKGKLDSYLDNIDDQTVLEEYLNSLK